MKNLFIDVKEPAEKLNVEKPMGLSVPQTPRFNRSNSNASSFKIPKVFQNSLKKSPKP